MIEVGRVCMKIAGRDAGQVCAVVEIIDKNYVLIDGQTRRRKCNVDHLEPLMKVVDISEGASHEDVVSELKKLGVETKAKSSKPKKAAEPKAPSKAAKEAPAKKAPKKKAAKSE